MSTGTGRGLEGSVTVPCSFGFHLRLSTGARPAHLVVSPGPRSKVTDESQNSILRGPYLRFPLVVRYNRG